ncbi:MAG: phosphate signaling complex protein PhoU [Armatimonadetes bacterium]|nr:phosphate signaling complex protein PhoU [Armatimonadota bacterium]
MAKSKQPFEEELKELRRMLLEMGVAAEEMIGDGIAALVRQNTELADAVLERDNIVDRMEQEVELHCLRLLSRKVASGSELRHITSALRVATDIERIADHAVDIAQAAKRLSVEAIYKPLVDIPHLGELAQNMLRLTLDAFVRRDRKQAPILIASDDEADALYKHMRGELKSTLESDPHAVSQAIYLLFVAYYLERICDHCTNIAERVGDA